MAVHVQILNKITFTVHLYILLILLQFYTYLLKDA